MVLVKGEAWEFGKLVGDSYVVIDNCLEIIPRGDFTMFVFSTCNTSLKVSIDSVLKQIKEQE